MLNKFAFLLMVGVIASTSANGDEIKTQPSQNKAKNVPYNFHGEADKTDSYAIPSDSSEEELDEEIDALNKKAKTAHQIQQK